jgi:hypothetical protein
MMHIFICRHWRVVLGFFTLSGFAELEIGADSPFAWQDVKTYRPPNFDGTFPDDPEGSKRLAAALPSLERNGNADESAFELLRLGLRALSVDHQTMALRWIGNAFIWNQSPQNPQAIDLMYHAAGSANSVIRYNAVYFGLSVVRPMTASILRALAEIGMNSEDPNVLSRIAWGASAQKEELLRHLQPHIASDDPARRQHAEALRRIFSGELKAFAWAEAKARGAAQAKYSDQLEEIRQGLIEKDSTARRETIELIHRERIALIMDETFIGAFAAAAGDQDATVRKSVAVITGTRWIWNQPNQLAEAIELMLRLSRDPVREVRYDAMYYGLSTLRNRSDEAVERMIEMTMQDGMDNQDFRQRIIWGLREERTTARRVLEKWMSGIDAIRALFAYGFHLDFFAGQPEAASKVTELLKTPDKTIACLLAFGPTAGWKGESMDEFLNTLRQELPAPHARRVLWTNNQGPPFVMVEEPDVRLIKEALLTSPHFKIAAERPLSVRAMVHIGKEGGLKSFDRK